MNILPDSRDFPGLPGGSGCLKGTIPLMDGKASPQVVDKEARRRRREIFFIFLIIFVLLILTTVEFSISRFRTALPFNDSILFFSMININIILILLLIFLILRNVVKLVFERRRRIDRKSVV